VCIVARPAGNIGSAPDALKVRRQFTSARNDVVTSGIELLLDQGAVRLLARRLRQQLLRGPPVVRAAAEVEPHPVEEFAMKLRVALE
jgi:hypothetical protein